MSHNLILVRHGEQIDAEHGVIDSPLSARGKLQAEAVGLRLAAAGITHLWHSPLDRAWETAQVIQQYLPLTPSEPSALLMDCVPAGKVDETPSIFDPFFGSVTEADIEAGAAQMDDAVAEFMAPSRQDQTDLLITHNAVIGWFLREALALPEWRWVTLSQSNCGITVLQRSRAGRPWAVISHNDVGHLSPELQTGMPGAVMF